MRRQIFIISLFLAFNPTISSSQINPKRDHKMFISNVAFGFISGVVGVSINSKNANFREILLRGGIQGAVGGSLMHLGKRSIYKFSSSGDTTDYWSSRLIFSAGNSIIGNASLNKWFYNSFVFNYLFLRVQINFIDLNMAIGFIYSEFLLLDLSNYTVQ